MRPLGRTGLFITCAFVLSRAIAACGFDGIGGRVDAGAGGAPGSDAASVDGGAPTDAGDEASTELFLDSGIDASFDGSACTPIAFDALGSGNWDVIGSAKVNAGKVDLTTANAGGSAGALWWKTPLTFSGRLHVIADFSFVPATGAQGNGLTVTWLSAAEPYKLGLQAGSYGICNVGLDGVAAAVDTLENKLVLISAVKNCDTRSALVPALPQLSRIAVDITQASITASIGSATAITATGMRDTKSPATGYLGLTASTGTVGHTGHVISAVQAFDCP